MSLQDGLALLPEILLVVWASALLLLNLFIPEERKGWVAVLAALGLGVALAAALALSTRAYSAFSGMVVVDGFAVFLEVLLAASGIVALALAHDYLQRLGLEQRGEYSVLLLFAVAGMMIIVQAADFIIIFLALELLSIPLYVLAGMARRRADSEEAALKYFLLGAFAAGFLVYGVALIYGATATTSFAEVVAVVKAGEVAMPLFVAGAALVLVGLAFKVAAVPFHMWTPDVYQGAPSSVTGFMAVGAKVAGFAVLLRLFAFVFPALAVRFVPVLWTLAVLTMVVGNFAALAQRNIKRMLAYSSIAHAGYILLALVPFAWSGVMRHAVAAGLFYLVAYAVANFGAWAVVVALEKAEGKGLDLEDYAGLARKYPALSVAMAVFMFSFAGMPPTVGFVGKFYLFRTAIEAGFVDLAVIGVLTSLVSVYYYLRVVVYMFMRSGEPEARQEPWLALTWGGMAVAVLVLGLFAAPVFRWAAQALMFWG
ncbi:MAG TPA: NADH-quinone oxidoreductase subunit N [Anaerolineae bacterium]|nr:NADH-quinone oxidoreductase subunit N [Anaerolineae bacterium]HID85649.1 NADH-quinone oxidoreductase subunit N [Anaerolineales bacterium]HIQ09352.1 NADH-quinone oxidoreductase subunit N [Anaerolineaceae bacterium]